MIKADLDRGQKMISLERRAENWIPVFRKKSRRPNNNLEQAADSN
jgi:hypothetical protein